MRRAVVVSAVLALVLSGSSSAARVTATDHRAIDRTIDGFVNAAVKRKDVGASWNLVTPDLKAGVSRKSWDAGNVPVSPYPAAGSSFHDWTVDSATRTQVDFELMIPSRKKGDSIQFNGTVKKLGGRWLIDSFNPSATFGGGAVVGGSDFVAPAAGDSKGTARLGSGWIAIPALVIGSGIVVLLGVFLFMWGRNRRARRAYRRPLEPIVVKRRESEPTFVPKERSKADA